MISMSREMSRDGVITRPIVNGGPANLAHGSEKSCPHPADLYSHKVYYGIYIERPIFPEDLARDFSRSAAFGRRKLDLEPVKGRLDMGRQLAAQNVVVEVEVHVGEDRPPGRKPLDPLERFGDREMARVRLVAQSIDDPQINASERRNAFRRQVAQVARVRDVADTEAERRDVAVVLQERQRGDRAALACDDDRFAGLDPMLVKNWRIVAAGRCHEAIAEAKIENPRSRLVEIDIDTSSMPQEQAAQIVDAVGVVGMLVREQYAIEPIDIGRQQLFAEIRRSVDQHASA